MMTAPTPQEQKTLSNNKDKKHLEINKEQTAEQIVKYLQQYYLEEQGWADRDDWYFCLTRLNKENKGKIDFYFTIKELKEEPQKIKIWIIENIEEYNLYHSIFIYQQAKRKAEFAIKESRVVFIDIDKQGHQPISIKEINKDIREIMQKWFTNREIHYSVIQSGRGIHIKIVLSQLLSEEEYKRLSLLTEIFRDSNFKVDNIYDFARIIRLPYSINQESKKQARIVYKTEETTKKEKFIELVNELEKLREARKNTEKEFDDDTVIDIDDDKLTEVARDVYLVIKDFYKQSTRHNLMFFTLSTIYKYSRITEEQLRFITEELISLLNDDEEKQRISIVKSIVKQEEFSGREKIATVSFFFTQDEQGNIIEDRRLSQFANANKLELEEAKEIIIKLKKDIIEVLKQKGYVYNKKFLGRVRISNKGRIVDVEVFRDSVTLAFYKRTDENELKLIGRENFIKARIILKEVTIKRNELKKTSEWLYTVKIISDFTTEEFKQASLKKIAEYLYGSPLVRMKSKQQIETILQAVFEILIRYYKIKITKLSETFEMNWDEEKKRYTHNAIEFWNETYSLSDTRNYHQMVSDDDIRKFLEILSEIQDINLFYTVSGTFISSYFNNELRMKPLLWVWSKEAGIGKSTLAELLTEKAFAIKKLSVQEVKSDFRIVKALSLGHFMIALDDVSKIDKNLRDFVKAYLTGVKSVTRGRADLSSLNIDLRATLMITSNNKLMVEDEAFKDRVIQIKLEDYVFETEETVDKIYELTEGVGYRIADLLVEYFRAKNQTFTDLVKESYKILKELNLNVHSRRLQLYAQVWAGLVILYDFAEAFGVEKLKEKLKYIAEHSTEIIEQIEAIQNDVSESVLYVDDIIEKLESATFIKRTDKGELLVTSTVLRMLRETNKLFEEIRSLKELETLINYKYKNIAKLKTVRINNKPVWGLLIDLTEVRTNKTDEEELVEEVYQLLKEVKNYDSISFDKFISLLLTRISVNDEEKVAEKVKELLLTKFRKNIELLGTEMSSLLNNSEVPVFKVKRI
ncbi:hypothetical protein TEU_03410 [Thermococcus eurythermalis]|uniref:Uncharacterized protein n=1 Tax=Thermococcus eurythermalis TaxID=1505907 RepID=A0A097QSP0_9EURY|nr:hypothetical protein [Thermococcus eurythermalis]AIU69469.1 hypothetical protein TEU_03410 [Thermococcus eurythermalis]